MKQISKSHLNVHVEGEITSVNQVGLLGNLKILLGMKNHRQTKNSTSYSRAYIFEIQTKQVKI